MFAGAMVMPQLVERSLPTPEVPDSNPEIGKIYNEHLLSTILKRRKKRHELPFLGIQNMFAENLMGSANFARITKA